jgi:hypothetical protein
VHKTQAEDNPETLATLGAQDTRRRQTNQKTQRRKLQKMSNTDTTKNPGVDQRAREFCFVSLFKLFVVLY